MDVASWRLCVGCGACACACSKDRITLVDIPEDGIRPHLDEKACDECGKCVEVCPGYATIHPPGCGTGGSDAGFREDFGPVLEIWEGYAGDDEIRYHGSSGGITSALALYCIEKEGMQGALHTGGDPGMPWKNRTVFSTTRSELLSCTGSRYSPASPCDGLRRIESSTGPCVFIGKPCDVVGTRMSQTVRNGLDRNIGLKIAFFCAGTPSTSGLLALLNHHNVEPGSVEEIRFRGKGWPGNFTVKTHDGGCRTTEMSYMESWGFLQRYRPYRCHLCPDGTGEFADLSCGDPWYREITEDEPGHSLVVVRTERGRRILRSAEEAGYVHLKRLDPGKLVDSQINLLGKRRAIFGRLLAMRLFGLPIPKLVGFSLFENWRKLPLKEKVRSTVGTARRIIIRRYYRKLNFS